MGVVPPPLPRVPNFGVLHPSRHISEEEKHAKRIGLYIYHLSWITTKKLVRLRDREGLPGETTFGLTQAERVPLWQAEYDKRTLLRSAQGVTGTRQNELLRAAGN